MFTFTSVCTPQYFLKTLLFVLFLTDQIINRCVVQGTNSPTWIFALNLIIWCAIHLRSFFRLIPDLQISSQWCANCGHSHVMWFQYIFPHFILAHNDHLNSTAELHKRYFERLLCKNLNYGFIPLTLTHSGTFNLRDFLKVSIHWHSGPLQAPKCPVET